MIDINPSQTSDKPLNLSDFAQRNQITEDRVWELIEEGELAARFVNDEILILREQEGADEPAIQEPVVELPAAEPIQAQEEVEADDPAPIEDMNPLLNDDHHDLLMFAQDAMNRTMDLSRQLLATKDELLRAKEERVQYLQADLVVKNQEIRMLKQKIEDLETLCRLNPL